MLNYVWNMKKEEQNKDVKDVQAEPAKGSRGTKIMQQRQRHKNTDDISMNEGFGVDHNSDPILAKKQWCLLIQVPTTSQAPVCIW